MPADTTTMPTGFELDEAANTLRFVRNLSATPQQVFDAWTKPDQVTAWWDAAGHPLTTCEIDLRVGGSFKFSSPSNPDHPFTGTYSRIDPPSRLGFDANGAAGSVDIQPAGDGSRMTVEIVSPTADHFAQLVSLGAHRGTAQTLDNLVAYLAD